MRTNLLFVMVNLIVTSLSLSAQNNNPCGVQASFTPSGDSIFTQEDVVFFQSTSVNATNYQFWEGNYGRPANQPAYIPIRKGLNEIKLIASNGSCSDTAVGYFFYSGTAPGPGQNSKKLYSTDAPAIHDINNMSYYPDGSLIVTGHSQRPSERKGNGFIMKIEPDGCVQWSKKVDVDMSANISMSTISGDGSSIYAFINSPVQTLTRLDNGGNIIWSKLIRHNSSPFIPWNMIATDNGVVAVGRSGMSFVPEIIAIDPNGSVLWHKQLSIPRQVSAEDFKHLLYKDNHIYWSGNLANTDISGNPVSFALLSKIDAANGNILWTRRYSHTAPIQTFILQNLADADSNILMIFMNQTIGGGLARLNTDGDILESKIVSELNPRSPNLTGYTKIFTNLVKSGKAFYALKTMDIYRLYSQDKIYSECRLLKIDSAYNFSWVEWHGRWGDNPTFTALAALPGDRMAIGGSDLIAATPNYKYTDGIVIQRMDSSGSNQNAECAFFRPQIVTSSFPITSAPFSWDSETSLPFSTADYAPPVHSFVPDVYTKCPDYYDPCRLIKLKGPRDICNLSTLYTYSVFRDRNCNQPVDFKFPANVVVIAQTDSTITVRFPGFGQYKIYATTSLHCTPVTDSIDIRVVSKTPPLELGADRGLCPGNTTVLTAGPGFLSYKWQDGSTDSSITINQPGRYWVEVTDSCSNVISDTITIFSAPSASLDAGPDRIKCNNDTVRLQAQTGFMNYQWSGNHFVSGQTSSTVIVNPVSDTVYAVAAESSPGCFAYDTIKVTVLHSPPVNLGPDRQVCPEGTTFDAGPGFQHYMWQNGATSSQISAHTIGVYHVMATAANGCRSFDTIRITQVHPSPPVTLEQNIVICQGDFKTIKTNQSFTSYLWSNGSQNPSIDVNTTGVYSVEVQDANGCFAIATTSVNKIQPPPTNFLPADTVICNYGSAVIRPLSTFQSYLWSTGDTSPTLTINQRGEYALRVYDEYNCTGTDYIRVDIKQCLKGLYVPSGFTPNGDGKNDLFVPSLFGVVKQYRFSIYNRYGNLLFNTTTPNKGWDGKISGVRQSSEVFVWVCLYQLEGEPLKLEKGTFVLIP